MPKSCSIGKRRSKALPALGFAGMSLSMASGACASTSEASANTSPPSQKHEIFLGEEGNLRRQFGDVLCLRQGKCWTTTALPKTKAGRRSRCRLWL